MGIHNQADVNALKRRVWGYVKDQNGSGLKDVGIYDHSKLLAVTEGGNGFYDTKILSGVPYTITPKKDGYFFVPDKIEIPANGEEQQHVDFVGYSSPGVVTLLSPSGTIYTSTPTYKWIASSLATHYGFQVTNSTGIPMVIKYYSDSEASCASGTCSVTPPTSLPDGRYLWDVQACLSADLNTCGPRSNFMDFIVSAGPKDPMVGRWSMGADGGEALVEERTTGAYTFVAKVTHVGKWWTATRHNDGGRGLVGK